MLVWWIDAFNAVWPWLAIGFLMVFNPLLAYGFHKSLPTSPALLEPLLSLVTATAIVLIGVFEPAWATPELIWTLVGFLSISVLQFAYYSYLLEGARGKKLTFSLYLGEVWWISCVHGGGFLTAWWWLTFADPAS